MGKALKTQNPAGLAGNGDESTYVLYMKETL